jgi:ABC-type multidrug transport system fused ATPase/permease subunit
VDISDATVDDTTTTDGTIAGTWCRLTVLPGESLVLWHWDHTALESMRRALQGFRSAEEWMISVDGVDLADIRSDVIRAHIAVVCEQEFLEATIAENVHLHRAGVTDADVLAALDLVGLAEEFRHQHRAVSEVMEPSGWPLTASQARRLTLARGLVGRPRALVIDQLLDSLSDDELRLVAAGLREIQDHTTLVIFTEQSRVAQLFPRVVHPRVEQSPARGRLPSAGSSAGEATAGD